MDGHFPFRAKGAVQYPRLSYLFSILMEEKRVDWLEANTCVWDQD